MSNTLKNLRARVACFSGYDTDDLRCHRFEANAVMNFTAETEDGSQLHAYLVVQVVVTSPGYPYQSHEIENNIRSSEALEKLVSVDSRWSSLSAREVGALIDNALKYEEIPELEARRYCHAVNRDLETFAMLRELSESDWERLQELDADERREEPAEEPIEEASEEESDLLVMARDLIDDGRCVSEVSFDDFQEFLETKIDAYFLSFEVAVTRRHDENPCVKAVVTCGGPYCDIRSFFGDYPEVYYRSGSRSRANIELSSVAREFFDTLIDRYIY